MNRQLFDLPVSLTSAWIFNCYTIHVPGQSDTFVLVDPGLPIVANRAIEQLTERGHPTAAITSVLCTHAHPDHVGGVNNILRCSAPEVHLPARCASYLRGEKPRTFATVETTMRFLAVWGEQPFERAALREFVKRGGSIGYGGPPALTLDFRPDGFVDDGDAMPGADGWTTIHTPGHTDDSTCFYHAESATLISGDAVVTQDGTAWFNPEYVCLDTALETEEMLRSLEVRHLLPGHGHPIEAADVWKTARGPTQHPTGNGRLARCSRRFGKWPTPDGWDSPIGPAAGCA